MTQRAGRANLPLHGGRVAAWRATRMAALGRVIAEAIVHHDGRAELLSRLSNPFWFQSFGAVMGGNGAHSRHTPMELLAMGDRTGIDARPS